MLRPPSISLFQRAIIFVRKMTLVPRNNNNFFSGTRMTRMLPTLTMDQIRRRNIHDGPSYDTRRDWICKECGFSNFSHRSRCFKCDAVGDNLSLQNSYVRPGDWTCKSCGFNNFSHRSRCFRCDEKPENRVVAEGDWICPNCEFYNFRSRDVCFKCNASPNTDINEENLT